MTEREKLWFNQMADEDKRRVEAETQQAVTRKKKVKRAKDPNAPKRALSGFFWFSNEERPKVLSHHHLHHHRHLQHHHHHHPGTGGQPRLQGGGRGEGAGAAVGGE